MRADVDLQGTVTAKDLLTQATLVAEKRVVADILGSLNHCNRKKRHVQFLYHSASISWQNYLLFPSSHFLFYPFQCNKIHSKWCLVSSYLLLETITFTNDGRGGAGIRELCPFVTLFFFHLNYICKASQKYDPVVYSNQERCNLFWHQNESYSEFYFGNDIS